MRTLAQFRLDLSAESRKRIAFFREAFARARRRFARARFRFGTRGTWLSDEISAALRNSPARRGRAMRLARLAVPTWSSLALLILAFAFSILVSWALARWNPHLAGLLRIGGLRSVYEAMWSVEAAVAVIALPLLLFVIQLPRGGTQAAPSSEVLIRESRVFAIIAYSLLGVARTGVDIVWFAHSVVFVVDFVFIFLAIAFMALYAYFCVVRLLFSPTLMQTKAREVVREKMVLSLDASLRLRVGGNRLAAWLQERGIGYWPFPPAAAEQATHVFLRARSVGTLVDVNLGRLEAFFNRLPYAAPPAGIATAAAPPAAQPPAGPADPRVWFMQRYGQRVGSDDPVVRLERSAFGTLDTEALEQDLAACLKLRPTSP